MTIQIHAEGVQTPTIGQPFKLDWSAAKDLGCEDMSFHTLVRVEAIGHDWIVMRNQENGKSYSTTFHDDEDKLQFMRALKSPTYEF